MSDSLGLLGYAHDVPKQHDGCCTVVRMYMPDDRTNHHLCPVRDFYCDCHRLSRGDETAHSRAE